jgi:nucleotide-binding universal stress UspA family protein
MNKVLVGVDLNTTYVWLMVRAADLAKCIDTRIDLVYVAAEEPAHKRSEHERTLNRLMDHIDEGLRGTAMVRDGDPITVLNEMSADYGVMAVGPREPTGWKRLVEKPMAVRLIADARCPVFIPRTEEPRTTFTRLLVGVDLAADDKEARLEDAGRWALALGGRLDAVYCEPDPARRLDGVMARNAAEQSWRDRRTANLKKLEALLENHVDGSARGEAMLSDVLPGTGLVNLSKDYDLLMVGTADVARDSVLLGSVAVDAVRHAHCDVLAFPA